MSEALLEVQSVMAAKIETTSGTAEALTASEGVFNVVNFKFEDDIEVTERLGQKTSSRLPSVPGTRAAKISFGVDACGLGSSGVPLWADAFLVACGFVKTVATYAPVTGSSTLPSLTIGG